MQFLVLVAAALGLAMPAIASPLQARALRNGLFSCTASILNEQTPQNAAALYTALCIKSLKCQHSSAPELSSGEYIGACLQCPDNISPSQVGDCLFVYTE